ncbi:DUF3087 family protein [Thalassotalea sp. LPB0316]|uniref:DUF3087 family protein n=1 Tax=Thalassotalea sp. LPB0316 TaxID=2769490 RepID=UPI0018685E1E|nr:DUF3087 family protein [Thalassotalea sp. LPB0316]QOL24944.1 DUF3087 family protein [Thalassotalea sp. LPB0316]
MILIDIDKATYRKHLNVVIVSFVLGFALLSLLFGQLLISQFSSGIEGESHFRFNLIGVVIGLAISSFVLSHMRKHEYFKEIYYVWQLKQLQNAIYRKVAKIKPKALAGDIDALQVMDFYYRSLAQVYELDNNTLTMNELVKNHQIIKDKAQEYHINLEQTRFDKAVLSKF